MKSGQGDAAPAEPVPEGTTRPGRISAWFGQLLAAQPATRTFAELVGAEGRTLAARSRAGASAGAAPQGTASQGTAEQQDEDATFDVREGSGGEHWVARTSVDRFGLALSGGGIRSATFNLGLLQSLARSGVLRHLDYLSTVSGGGYIGGFWTAWLHRHAARPGEARFPLGGDERGGEPAEIRHLREFSRFLLPRIGLMETSLWHIVMTMLGGLLPSFAAAIAVLVLAWSTWLGVLVLLCPGAITCGGWLSAFLLLAYLAISEVRWRGTHASEPSRQGTVGYVGGTALAVGAWLLAASWMGVNDDPPTAVAVVPWLSTLLLDVRTWFLPAALLALIIAPMLVLRLLVARVASWLGAIGMLAGFERALSRLLGPTFVFAVLAALWWAASAVMNSANLSAASAASAVSSTALFVLVRKWLAEPIADTRGSRLADAVIGYLRRGTPKLLATVSFLLIFMLVGIGLRMWLGSDAGMLPVVSGNHPEFSPHLTLLAPVLAACLVVLFSLVALDPTRVGLHEFYRARIARCYLGASNPSGLADARGEFERARRNRYLDEREDDDLTLGALAAVPRAGPIHLVCTAANDMSGDRVGTLYRGARSAVLSMHGITLGNENAPLDDLRLSSALTASAAAFNSQMGRMSVDFGPAVTFLMSALNLRLGLWVPHPSNTSRGRSLFPGRMFFDELLGRSSTTGSHLHLSDGNHFENLGLYELVRRHCRYIVVVDCGQDQDVAFDDLANVLRRVREDFNVEIELDVSQLRPDAKGLARQHAVVGTIHYNGPDAVDKGTIVFMKPVLTGDEPADVAQYRTRNAAFPSESTGDQFFDEAQWESYRRLGEHVGHSMFGFLETEEIKQTNEVDQIFRNLRSRWYSAPDVLDESATELAARCDALEQELFAEGPVAVQREFLPEAAGTRAAVDSGTAAGSTALAELAFVLRAARLLEDIWRMRALDSLWFHPANQNWMSYCERWAATPTFRRWWPIMAPLLDSSFREFAKARFSVGVVDRRARAGSERAITGARASLCVNAPLLWVTASDTWRQFNERHVLPEQLLGDGLVHAYELSLQEHVEPGFIIGFVIAVERRGTADERRPAATSPALRVRWHAEHLYVVPALHGAGIVSRLLDAVVAHYTERATALGAVIELIVTGRAAPVRVVGGKPRRMRRNRGQRFQVETDIEFYKSRGFEQFSQDAATLRKIVLPAVTPAPDG